MIVRSYSGITGYCLIQAILMTLFWVETDFEVQNSQCFDVKYCLDGSTLSPDFERRRGHVTKNFISNERDKLSEYDGRKKIKKFHP